MISSTTLNEKFDTHVSAIPKFASQFTVRYRLVSRDATFWSLYEVRRHYKSPVVTGKSYTPPALATRRFECYIREFANSRSIGLFGAVAPSYSCVIANEFTFTALVNQRHIYSAILLRTNLSPRRKSGTNWRINYYCSQTRRRHYEKHRGDREKKERSAKKRR